MSVLNEIGLNPEYALLGSWITFPERCLVRTDVTADWFSEPAARYIHRAIVTVPAGTLVGPIAVAERLKAIVTRGQSALELIGGEDFFMQVMEAAIGPSQEQSAYEQLRLRWMKRKTQEIGQWITGCADKDLSPGEIASRLLEAASEIVGARKPPVIRIGDVDHTGDDMGVPSGFPVLDGMTSTGGFACGQSNVVSAYHKGGKTSFMLSSALLQLKAGYRVLWATFADLNQKQIKRRILKNLCGWSKPPTSLELLANYDESLAWLNGCGLDVYDATAVDSGFDVDTFATWLKAHHEQAGYDCVFMDYAQKLRSSEARSNKFSEGDYCSEVVARLAAQTDLPIVIGSQVTPGGKDGETKTKNSRAWEEDAGLVLRLQKDGDYVKIEVPYSRFGPSGEFTVAWDAKRVRMVTQ